MRSISLHLSLLLMWTVDTAFIALRSPSGYSDDVFACSATLTSGDAAAAADAGAVHAARHFSVTVAVPVVACCRS